MATKAPGENKEIAGKALKVKLEPVEFLGNKNIIDLLNDKNEIPNVSKNKTPKIVKKIWNRANDSGTTLNILKSRNFLFLHEQIRSQGNMRISRENYIGKNFFKVLNYNFFGNQIILHTTDGKSYIGNLQEYLKKGLEVLEFYDEGNIMKKKNKKEDKKESINNLGNLNIETKKGQIVINNNGKEVNDIQGDFFDIINAEERIIFVIDDNKLEKLKISDDGKSYETIGNIIDLGHLGDIKQIKFDNNKNFLNVIALKNNEYTLYILNNEGIEKYEEIMDIKEILYFDEVKNSIYCVDKDDKLRYINTNFNNFETNFSGKIGKQTELAKQQALKILQGGISIGTNNNANNVNKDLINEIYETKIDINGEKKKFKQIINDAKTPKDFEEVDKIIAYMKSIEAFSKIPGLFDSIEIDIKAKSDKIRLEDIYKNISKIEKDLENEDTELVMFSLYKKELENIVKVRGTINIPTDENDKKVGILMKRINDKIKDLKETASDEIMESINENIEILKSVLEDIIFVEHINNIYNSDEYKKILELSDFLNTAKKIEVKKDLKKLIQDKINFLETEKLETEKQEQKENEEKIKSIRKDFIEIKNLVDLEKSEINILKIKSDNGLVANVIDRIFELSITDSKKLHSELDNIFNKKISSLRFGKNVFKSEGNLIDFGDGVKVSKFIPEIDKKISWSIKGKRNNGEIIIYFENNLGGKIEPEIEKMYRLDNPLAVDKKDFAILQDYVKKWNSIYKKEFYDKLSEYKKSEKLYLEKIESGNIDDKIKENYEKQKKEFEEIKSKSYLARMFYKLPRNKTNARPNVPEIQPNTVIGSTTKKFLKDFAALADTQIKSKGAGSGIVIIESDAGTGKNFKIDLYAHFTNREVFEMQGNKTAQKEDILYSYELGPDGTYRLPSHLIKGITTPGSIIVFDEINTYPAEVLKLLNPLLDIRRSINDPQMGKIKVADDVVIVGLMNPSNYLGTSKLSQEIKSRARFMIDKYPEEFDENGNSSYEEAYLISRHFKGDIGNMDEQTFEGIWQKVVVKNKNYNDKDLEQKFRDLRKYIEFVNELRKQYQDTQSENQSGEEFNFIVSLREGIQIIEEYDKNGGSIKQAIIDVIKPKIEENEEKEFFENKVNNYFK